MALPKSLSSLSVRESITDALYRAINGLDMADTAIFDSAFTQDAVFDLNGKVSEGLKAIHTDCFDFISKLDTTHFLTNVRVDVKDGESKASVTCSAQAQHYRPGQGLQPGAIHLLTGSLYNFDLVKDESDGLWKIKYWKLKLIWTDGDWAVFSQG